MATSRSRPRDREAGRRESVYRVSAVGLALLIMLTHQVVAQSPDDTPAIDARSGLVNVDHINIWNRYQPRLSIRHEAGETVGIEASRTFLAGFVPFQIPQSDWLLYGDSQAVFLKDRALGASLGIGLRTYSSTLDAVVGISLHHDYRDTGVNEFQQLGPGFELLGRNWEARANGYLASAFDVRKMAPNQFRGNVLFIDRFESAMSGFDAEAGVSIPVADRFEPRAFAGFYHFQAPRRQHLWGWKGRLEATVSDAVGMSLAVQNDRLFETTVSHGVEVGRASWIAPENGPSNAEWRLTSNGSVRSSLIRQKNRWHSIRIPASR